MARGEGAYVWDVEGRRYIDYVQSYGASILGHAHPTVVAAIQRAAELGTTFGAPTERRGAPGRGALRPGRRLRAWCGWSSSGTEATMSAVRLARGATGRDRVVLFAGCYHGHSDGLLAGGRQRRGHPRPARQSAGVTEASVADTIVAPYNVVPEIGDDVACVIVEPVAANMGLVPPAAGFLEGLRARVRRAPAPC